MIWIIKYKYEFDYFDIRFNIFGIGARINSAFIIDCIYKFERTLDYSFIYTDYKYRLINYIYDKKAER